MIRHVVFMRWQDGTSEEDVRSAREALNTMPGLIDGIVRYELGSDIGLTENKFDLALVADFASAEDYRAYGAHAAHAAVVETAIKPILAELQRVQYEI